MPKIILKSVSIIEYLYIFYFILQVQHALKKSEMALQTLDKAISIDPNNPLCKFHRASILFANDKHRVGTIYLIFLFLCLRLKRMVQLVYFVFYYAIVTIVCVYMYVFVHKQFIDYV